VSLVNFIPWIETNIKRKIPRSYSPADLPFHAKGGREWGRDNSAGSLDGHSE